MSTVDIVFGIVGGGIGGIVSTLPFHRPHCNLKTVEIMGRGCGLGIAYTIINTFALAIWESTAEDMAKRAGKNPAIPSLQQRCIKTVISASVASLAALALQEDLGTSLETFTCWVVANAVAYLAHSSGYYL